MMSTKTCTHEEFLHGLARFRSAQRTDFLELASLRHNYHTALAIQRAYKIHTELPSSITCLESSATRKIAAFYLKSNNETIDLFGSKAAQRFLEFSFQDDIDSYNEISFESSTSLEDFINDAGFFLDYWDPNPEFFDSIVDGISAAIDDFFSI